mgnify:CR=1 FL=1
MKNSKTKQWTTQKALALELFLSPKMERLRYKKSYRLRIKECINKKDKENNY